IFESFHGLVTGRGAGEDLGKLKAFSGVSRFPLRVKCATLAWHALRSALDDSTSGQAKAALE
ncbi:MAG: SUF system NifU family Fe-S cluster assembly protein, partial [Gemmatimonadales bacterium]